MADEITFMDLATLLKITPNTPLEKLGTAINASIFDASNMAGTLKQKGLIEFTANYPGPNAITITETGQNLLKEADLKSTTPADALDESLLIQMSGGKRLPIELQNTLSIRPRDLAMRLYKLNKQNLMIYELKNGGVDLLLTEQGFLHAKSGGRPPAQPSPLPPPAAAPTMQAEAPPTHINSSPTPASGMAMPPPLEPGSAMPPHLTPNMHAMGGGTGKTMPMMAGAIVVIIIIIVLLAEHII